MASRYDIYNDRAYDVNRAIREYRDTLDREQDRNRNLTFLEKFGIEEDSDKDRLDALEAITRQYGDPSYALRGPVTRNTQKQAEYIRDFLRGVDESAAAGETDMADRVIDLVSAGDFGFESLKRLENPQEFLQADRDWETFLRI